MKVCNSSVTLGRKEIRKNVKKKKRWNQGRGGGVASGVGKEPSKVKNIVGTLLY